MASQCSHDLVIGLDGLKAAKILNFLDIFDTVKDVKVLE